MNGPNVALDEYPFMLVSDIHADPKALERVLAKSPDVRYKCFLGDVIGYGDEPEKAVDLISGFDVGIMGNHDALAVGKNDLNIFSDNAKKTTPLHVEMLSEDQLNIISGFVNTFKRNGYLLLHGSPESFNHYLFNEEYLKKTFENHPEFQVFFGGHLHIPRFASYDLKSGKIEFEELDKPFSRHHLDLSKKKYFINCPSTTSGRLGSDPGYCTFYHVSHDEKILNYHFFD